MGRFCSVGGDGKTGTDNDARRPISGTTRTTRRHRNGQAPQKDQDQISWMQNRGRLRLKSRSRGQRGEILGGELTLTKWGQIWRFDLRPTMWVRLETTMPVYCVLRFVGQHDVSPASRHSHNRSQDDLRKSTLAFGGTVTEPSPFVGSR